MPDLRMPDLNHVLIAGNLTRDPELRSLPSGMAVCKLGLAQSRHYTKDGEKKEDTTFIDVKAWGKTAEYCHDALRKGQPVLVEGKLSTETWEKDGQKRSATVIVATRVQQMSWTGEKPVNGTAQAATSSKPISKPTQEEIAEDDIPF